MILWNKITHHVFKNSSLQLYLPLHTFRFSSNDVQSRPDDYRICGSRDGFLWGENYSFELRFFWKKFQNSSYKKKTGTTVLAAWSKIHLIYLINIQLHSNHTQYNMNLSVILMIETNFGDTFLIWSENLEKVGNIVFEKRN